MSVGQVGDRTWGPEDLGGYGLAEGQEGDLGKVEAGQEHRRDITMWTGMVR